MSEREINDRRNWKAQVFPYDYFIPDDSPECQYCLTDKQAEILRGIIEPLAWHTRWWSDSDTPIDQDTIQAFRDDLIRRLMMSCCGDEAPVQYRYTVDGVLQKSTDGGTTWVDAPENDTRNNSPQFPPTTPPGTNPKCVAADGMVKLIKQQVGDNLTDDMTRYTLAQLISDWVTTLINTSNPFQALVTIAANQIFALVISVLRPALTDEVYSKLKCIFYCNMADDYSFDQAAVDTVRGQVTDQIPGIAGVFFEHLIFLLGPVGMTNLARSGAGDPDATCDECCPSCGALWHVLNDDHANYGTIIDSGDDYITVQASYSYENRYDIHVLTNDVNSCCQVIMVENLVGHTQANFWLDCGETTPFRGGGLSSWVSSCNHYMIGYSDVPFTVKITFADCP